MVVIRLYEGEMDAVPLTLRRLLFVEILGCEDDGSNYIPSKAHPDPFIRCMARWIMQDYCGSLTTLLQTDVGYSHPKAVEMENAQDRMSGMSFLHILFYIRRIAKFKFHLICARS